MNDQLQRHCFLSSDKFSHPLMGFYQVDACVMKYVDQPQQSLKKRAYFRNTYLVTASGGERQLILCSILLSMTANTKRQHREFIVFDCSNKKFSVWTASQLPSYLSDLDTVVANLDQLQNDLEKYLFDNGRFYDESNEVSIMNDPGKSPDSFRRISQTVQKQHADKWNARPASATCTQDRPERPKKPVQLYSGEISGEVSSRKKSVAAPPVAAPKTAARGPPSVSVQKRTMHDIYSIQKPATKRQKKQAGDDNDEVTRPVKKQAVEKQTDRPQLTAKKPHVARTQLPIAAVQPQTVVIAAAPPPPPPPAPAAPAAVAALPHTVSGNMESAMFAAILVGRDQMSALAMAMVQSRADEKERALMKTHAEMQKQMYADSLAQQQALTNMMFELAKSKN